MANEAVEARCRQFIDAAVRHDVETLGALVADDIVWHVGGEHGLSGDYRGRDTLLDYMTQVNQLTNGSLGLAPVEIVADDEHAGIFVRTTMARDDRQVDVLMAELFRLGADGRFTEFWAVPNDQAAIDAFWSRSDGREDGEAR